MKGLVQFLDSFDYSSDPNKRAGPNKLVGLNFDKNEISVQS